jgi:sugar/nucleoside kinase (ribokinase family)
MLSLVPLEPVDYLVIGHVTEDKTPTGMQLGGTAAYAALTARALGLRVGIVTAAGETTSLARLQQIATLKVPSQKSTTFRNIHAPEGRRQVLEEQAAPISLEGLPAAWRHAPIVHLGPVAQELDPQSVREFSPALLGLTPQGWMRTWDTEGRVSPVAWASAEELLPKAGAVVLSLEDVQGDQEAIEAMAHQTRVLCVTEGAAGSVLYWNGDRRRFRAPEVEVVDETGAGDVFAAAFFVRMFATRDPWEAARFATLLGAWSVTRLGLDGIPTPAEVESCTVEVLK